MTYSWTLNGTVVAATSTYTIPSSVKADDVITVIVTDADGDTASDSVIVGATTELALKSVEDASGGRGNVVIAYFNKPIGDLNPSDIQIRRLADDQLTTIESVSVSSDGLSAVMTLANTNAAGANAATLLANTDYKMIVTSNKETAEKEFYIPATDNDVTIYAVDATKKTLSGGQLTTGVAGAATVYNVPEELAVDYANLLGETVTVKYDKTNTIISINKKAGERVIYGAFKEFKNSTSDYGLQDLATETKYYPNTGTGTVALSSSYGVAYENVAAPALKTAAGTYIDGTTYKYGKLVLNTNGTIKNFLHLTKWSGCMMVASTLDNYIIGVNKQEQTLKDYTILSNGYSIAVDDIDAGDIVFYNTTYKMAAVFDDVDEGPLEAVYDGAGFRFDGKDRDGSNASYFDGTTLKAVTTDYLKALDAEGEDITVYYDRSKTPVFVLGETGEVASTSTDLILTKAGDGFVFKTDNVIRLKGFDGSSTVTEEFNLSDLKKISINGATTDTSLTKVTTGVNGALGAWGADVAKEEIASLKSDKTYNAKILELAADMPVGRKVTIKKNDSGKVIELSVGTPIAMAVGTRFDDKTAANSKFEAGLKAITTNAAGGAGANFSSSTNVFIINAGPTVTKESYGDFAGAIAQANLGYITFYTNSAGTAVTDVVINNQNGVPLGDNTDGSTTTEVVIKDIKYLDGKISGLTVINGTEETTYTEFGDDASLKGAYNKGDIVNVTVLKDEETVGKIAADTDTAFAACTELYGVTTTGNGSAYYYAAGAMTEYTFDPNVTIVKINDDNSVSDPISLSDLKTEALTKRVTVSLKTSGNKVIDKVVVGKNATGRTLTVVEAIDDVFEDWGDGSVDFDGANGAAAVAAVGSSVNHTNANAPAVAINTKAKYDDAVAAVKLADIVIADYDQLAPTINGAGVTTNRFDSNNANPDMVENLAAYNAVKAAITATAKTLIVKSATINDVTIAKADANTTDAQNALLAKLPTSVVATTADGTSVTLSIPLPTAADRVGATNQYGAWMCNIALAPNAGTTAHTFTLQPGTYNGVAYTFAAGAAPTAKVTTGA